MKNAKFTYQYEVPDDAPGLSEIRLVNDMAPITIEGQEETGITIEAELPFEASALPDPQELFEVTIKDGVAEIHLEELPDIRDSFLGGQKLKVSLRIPSTVRLDAETENMPMSITGILGGVNASTENGPVILSNCNGGLELESENGPVKLRNCSGIVKIKMENGALTAEAVQGDKLELESENGPVKIRSARFPKVEIGSENGVIYYETLPVEDGDFSFSSENGIIHLVLPLDFDFDLEGETENGALKCRIDAQISNEDGNYRIWRGDNGAKIKVKTENGLIKLSSDGNMNLDFLRMKLDELKVSINNSKTFEDKEEVLGRLNSVIDYVAKLTLSIDEEKIKSALNDAMEKLKGLVAGFDVNETKEKVISGVEDIAKELSQTLGSLLEKVKIKVEHEFRGPRMKEHMHHFQDEMRGVGEQIRKAFKNAGLKGFMGAGMAAEGHETVADRSRLKILEMLESGKITAEEAERLLKAISKE